MTKDINIYYCIDDKGLENEVGDFLRMSIKSAIEYSCGKVRCLYSGSDISKLNYLCDFGVEVIEIESRIVERIQSAIDKINFPQQAKGAYLRYEIADIDENEYSLYVDCDVIFAKKFSPPEKMPKFIGAVREKFNSTQFNSGVLLINNKAFSKRINDFLDYAASNFGTWTVGVDQYPFNKFFAGDIEELDDVYNSRFHDDKLLDPFLVHFHGAKINEVYQLLFNQIDKELVNEYLIERAFLISKSYENMLPYMKIFEKYLSDDNSKEFIEKYRNILQTTKDDFCINNYLRTIANNSICEKFLHSKPLPESTKVKIDIDSLEKVYIYPGQNMFYGTISTKFLDKNFNNDFNISSSSGHMNILKHDSQNALIAFSSLSFASHILITCNEAYTGAFEVELNGVSLGFRGVQVSEEFTNF
jgi:lipopolysaccharide biosynthesis glycosyltransferase